MPIQFGERTAGHTVIDRPGVYGITFGNGKTVLVVTVGHMLAFPGGGLEKGETYVTALQREFEEETGYRVRILRSVGHAKQYVFAQDENAFFNKLCQFYEVALVGDPATALDRDHQCLWMPVEQAAATLTEEAHRWALSRALTP